ncbi:MAG: malate dehydrogenase [Actinomycetota bacterium]
MRKIAVVGAGMVGSTTAMRVAEAGLADVALIDVYGDLARGKALDISQALPLAGSSCRVEGGDDYRLAEGSEVVVVTAGFPRQPGMSRADLLGRNAEVVRKVVESAAAAAPESVIIMVTNPLDEMSYLAWRVTGWDRHRVMGMAGLLDGSRLAYFAARELGIHPAQVQPMVLGSHGEAMLPLPRFTTVAGVSLDRLLPPGKLEELGSRTREGGAEIVSLLRTGSAYYAPSACVVRMVEAVLRDEDYLVTASVRLEGEYGLDGVFLGVPVVLGSGGWKKVVELPLDEEERRGLEECARLLRGRMEELDGWLAGA